MGTPASRLMHDLFKGPKRHQDPGNGKIIRVDEDLQICEMTSGASGETRTLATPSKAGIRLVLRMKTDGGGDIVVTASAGLNVALETQATFADASDFLSLISVTIADGPPATYRWEILEGNVGTVISSASASSTPSSSPSASTSTSPSASVSGSPSTSPSASASGTPSSSPSSSPSAS